MRRTVIGLQTEAPVLASVLLPASNWFRAQFGSAGLYSAHGYRAAPGCVFSLGRPFIAPLKLRQAALLALTLTAAHLV